MNVSEASEKWNISLRRVRKLCEEGRIEGVFKIGRAWNIPVNSTKPIDKRVKNKIIFKIDNKEDIFKVDKLKNILDSFRPISKETLKSLKEDIRLRLTYNSNAIEGNTLTLKETKVALEGITIGGKTMIEHLEVINHNDAILYLEDIINDKEDLTEMTIKNIHMLILKEIDKDNSGVYRKQNVIISGAEHIPPDYIKIYDEMSRLVNMYNNEWKKYHPLVRASLLHGEFVKIHPFIDGNGRTARLLLNYSLMRDKYIPVIITNKIKSKYYESLDKAHITKDYIDFISVVSECLQDDIKRWLKVLEK